VTFNCLGLKIKLSSIAPVERGRLTLVDTELNESSVRPSYNEVRFAAWPYIVSKSAFCELHGTEADIAKRQSGCYIWRIESRLMREMIIYANRTFVRSASLWMSSVAVTSCFIKCSDQSSWHE
jgi:hypothetical protein